MGTAKDVPAEASAGPVSLDTVVAAAVDYPPMPPLAQARQLHPYFFPQQNIEEIIAERAAHPDSIHPHEYRLWVVDTQHDYLYRDYYGVEHICKRCAPPDIDGHMGAHARFCLKSVNFAKTDNEVSERRRLSLAKVAPKNVASALLLQSQYVLPEIYNLASVPATRDSICETVMELVPVGVCDSECEECDNGVLSQATPCSSSTGRRARDQ